MHCTQKNQLNWYVGYTRPKCERKLYEKLLQDNIESYLPLVKEKRQRTDRVKTIETPLFPSYIFIKTTAHQRWKLLEHRELVKYVTFGSKPAMVNDMEIERIGSVISSNVKVIPRSMSSCPNGTTIEFEEGLFKGMQGIIVGSGSRRRLIVRIDNLRQNLELHLDSDKFDDKFKIQK